MSCNDALGRGLDRMDSATAEGDPRSRPSPGTALLAAGRGSMQISPNGGRSSRPLSPTTVVARSDGLPTLRGCKAQAHPGDRATSKKLHTVLALAAWLAVAATARASVLSDNLFEYPAGDETATATHWVCAGFGTDSKTYNLTSVELATSGWSGLDSDIVLEIYTSTGAGYGQPAVLVGTLTTPVHIAQPFTTFPAQGIVLSPSSTYWVVLRTKPGASTVQWSWTHSFVSSGVGWKGTWGISDDSGVTWATYYSSPQRMRVNAQPVPWTDLGLALSGSHGKPQLDGAGTLEAGSSGSISLWDAAWLAPALIYVSTSSTPLPFKGGTLATVPVLQSLPITTDEWGSANLPWTAWPPGLSGVSLFAQAAVQDASAAKGVALSNALRADVP